MCIPRSVFRNDVEIYQPIISFLKIYFLANLIWEISPYRARKPRLPAGDLEPPLDLAGRPDLGIGFTSKSPINLKIPSKPSLDLDERTPKSDSKGGGAGSIRTDKLVPVPNFQPVSEKKIYCKIMKSS